MSTPAESPEMTGLREENADPNSSLETAGALIGTMTPEERVVVAQKLLAGIDPKNAQPIRNQLRSFLQAVEQNGSVTDPCDLNWRTMIDHPEDKARFDFWKKKYEYWKANEKNLEHDLRNMLQTYPEQASFEQFQEMMNTLRLESYLVVESLLEDLLPGIANSEERQNSLPHPAVVRAKGVLELLSLIYEEQDTVAKEDRARVRFEAFRTFSLMLLCRTISRKTVLPSRREDSTYFEEFLIRKHTGLIKEDEDYKEVTVWFKPGEKNDDATQVKFEQQEGDEWESTTLYKIRMTGRVSPFSDEQKSVDVYCFPGNKSLRDAKEIPGLSARQQHDIGKRKTIVNYKDNSKIALKLMRKNEVLDGLRMTALVERPEDLEVINNILQTTLGSAIARKKWGKTVNNPASSKAYNGYGMTQTVEELNYEEFKRNFFIEIRTGILGRGILDKSKRRHPASHIVYGERRSLPIAKSLFPKKIYPEFQRVLGEIEASLSEQ